MPTQLRTETETVIKRILPYMVRRGYDIEADFDFETAVKLTDRYRRGYVDILVRAGKAKPVFLIEAKRSAKRLTKQDYSQSLEYGASLKVRFVVVTNGIQIHCFNANTGKPIRWNGKLVDKIPTRSQLNTVITYLKANADASDVPLGNNDSLPFRPGLPLKQLNDLFKRCHNRIRKIEKNEENVFADFSKLLFLKLLEEKHDTDAFELPYSYRFHEITDSPPSESDQVKDAVLKMLALIRDQTEFGDVLGGSLHIKNPRTFHYLVSQLAAVSFSDSSLDSKGAAFEYYVRATLKGKKLGQYFTPRPLVELMLCVVGQNKIVNSLLAGTELKVLDPACGTGGFLVYLMQKSLAILGEKHSSGKFVKKTRDQLAEKLMRSTFYGSDANEGVASAAKMNMIIAGDGHANITAEDSLAASASNWNIGSPDCDLILTNPPFGTSEAESLTESDMELYPVRSTKGQHLFLQKMVLASVSGGEICTVIDDGVLNTTSATELRRWLLQTCELRTVIRLPHETFRPNKINVRSSVLYLRRREINDTDLEEDYPIAFCNIETLGYSSAGESLRSVNFEHIKTEIAAALSGNSTSSKREGEHWSIRDISAQSILTDQKCRLDLKYWNLDVRNRIDALVQNGNTATIEELNNLSTRRGKSPTASSYVGEADGYALVVKAGSNISKFGQLIEAGDFIEKSAYDEMKDFQLKYGDVLLASTGEGTLGKCCVFRSRRPAIADGHVTFMRVNPRHISPEYLSDYLRAGFGSAQIQMLYSGSTGLIELEPSHVDSIIVDLLSGPKEQRSVSTKLRAAERQYAKRAANAEDALRKAYGLFSSRNSA